MEQINHGNLFDIQHDQKQKEILTPFTLFYPAWLPNVTQTG